MATGDNTVHLLLQHGALTDVRGAGSTSTLFSKIKQNPRMIIVIQRVALKIIQLSTSENLLYLDIS